MVKIVTTQASIYIPIAQIKRMFYERKQQKVKVIGVDEKETEYQSVVMVFLNGAEI